MNGSGWAPIDTSVTAKRTRNPIREVVETIHPPATPHKPIIPLSLGDPTIFGNLKTPNVFVEAIIANLKSFKHNGYIHSAGATPARIALAKRYSLDNATLTEDDVYITSGCSGAVVMALHVLLNEGDNLVGPCPGFALYKSVTESCGAYYHPYNLLPERGWEADLGHLESLITSKTKAILVNNPSNPCGSVYTKEHLEAIVAIAEKYKLPLIADEIYGGQVFAGSEFFPMASLTTTVPVLSVGGIAKEFLVPGWRVGWIIVYDRNDLFAVVRKGLSALSQITLSSCSLIQSALPALLTPEPGSADEAALAEFRTTTIATLEAHAKFTVDALSKIQGLRVVMPQGAMYVMFGWDASLFPTIEDDIDFTKKLLAEECVFVLPGQCFGVKNFCRVVFSSPMDKLADAYERMAAFCDQKGMSLTPKFTLKSSSFRTRHKINSQLIAVSPSNAKRYQSSEGPTICGAPTSNCSFVYDVPSDFGDVFVIAAPKSASPPRKSNNKPVLMKPTSWRWNISPSAASPTAITLPNTPTADSSGPASPTSPSRSHPIVPPLRLPTYPSCSSPGTKETAKLQTLASSKRLIKSQSRMKSHATAPGDAEDPEEKLRFRHRIVAERKELAVASRKWHAKVLRAFNSALSSAPGLSFVTDNILIGNREDAQSCVKLVEYGVSHVINATQQLPNYHPDRFVYCNLPMLDTESEDIRAHLPIAFAAIDDVVKGGTRCLVHCIAGVSRSPAIVIAYLVVRMKMPLVSAMRLVRKRRNIVMPNESFRYQLARLEIDNFGGSSVKFCKDDVWDFPKWAAIRYTVDKRP